MAKKSSTRKAKDTPKTAQASWCSLFIKHSTRGPDIDEVVEELSEDSRFASASNDDVNPWLTGKAIKSSSPTVVCVSIARQKWLSLVGGAIDVKFASRIGRRKKLKTIYVGYDNEKSSSFFRYYENGKMQVDFEVRGAPDSCMEKYRLKTTKDVKSYVKKASNIGMAIKALLKKFDAISPEIRIEHDGLNQKLVRVDGSKLATKQIREISVLKYYALVDGENAASDLLALALHEGKPAKVKKAIKAGANLEHIPSSSFGPIRHAVIGVDGAWEECTRLLAKAGAPIDGLAGEEPPIVGVCQSYGTLNVRGTDDASVIERIKLLLALGANINARVYTSAPPGWTALHQATDSCRLKVVKFLVSKRADSSVQDSKGQRAIDIASELSKIYHGEMGEASKAIVNLLKSKKTSKK